MMSQTPHHLLPQQAYASYAAYRAATGEEVVKKARSLLPSAILAEISASGLRGRGGAGFPTGTKWQSIAHHPCSVRYAVCNAAEGEPGTFKDRWLLRKNPYAVIEGLLIAAYTVQAKAAYIALKAAFIPEAEALRRALAEMAQLLFLPVILAEGPEEYLFGEEKALLNVIEGEGPFPRPADQPPYEWGLFASPTCANPALVNNVQTLAHVSTILRHGAESFRGLGTADTPGTLIFTLSGDIARPGIYELPAGLSLERLLHEIGGGPLAGRKFKALLPGISAPVVLPETFSAACDFGSFHALGSGLGSAGFMVLDDAASMPRVTQALARFLYVESCLQCPPCKIGLGAASEALDALLSTKPNSDDLEKALLRAQSAPQGNRCYLPVQGSLLIPSLLAAFAEEFQDLFSSSARAPEWTVPKMTDFDEENGRFSYDLRQARKQADWTYEDVPETLLSASSIENYGPEPSAGQMRSNQKPAH